MHKRIEARRRKILFAVAILSLGFVSLVSASTGTQTPVTPVMSGAVFVPRPLTNASLTEIGQAADTYVTAKYPLYSGTPQLLLTRTVTPAELPALGLGTYSSGTVETPPLALTITKGDFGPGTTLGGRGSSTARYRYIGLL